MTPGIVTPSCAHSWARTKRTVGPARPCSTASEILLRTGPALSAIACPACFCLLRGRNYGARSRWPTRAGRSPAPRVGGTPPQPCPPVAGAGHGPVPIRLPEGRTPDSGGSHAGLQLESAPGRPHRGVGQPRAPPRGRGLDPSLVARGQSPRPVAARQRRRLQPQAGEHRRCLRTSGPVRSPDQTRAGAGRWLRSATPSTSGTRPPSPPRRGRGAPPARPRSARRRRCGARPPCRRRARARAAAPRSMVGSWSARSVVPVVSHRQRIGLA